MDFTRTFKFVDDNLNRKLIGLVKKSRVEHFIDKEGVLHYSPGDEDSVENDLVCSIRDQVFPSWQVLTCPGDWVERYKRYMSQHDIPYIEELANNEVWFLLPRKYRSHSWKLD